MNSLFETFMLSVVLVVVFFFIFNLFLLQQIYVIASNFVVVFGFYFFCVFIHMCICSSGVVYLCDGAHRQHR